MLNVKELSVLYGIAYGLEVKEIAHILGVSRGTIQAWLKNACIKLGCGNRTYAVVKAIKLELLDLGMITYRKTINSSLDSNYRELIRA